MKGYEKTKIALVEFQPELPNLSSFNMFPFYGTIILGTKLHNTGFDVTVFVEGISKFSIDDLDKFHFICFATKSPAANKIYNTADSLRKKGKTVIMGGTHATYFPEDCLLHSDYVIHGEGDEALPKLIYRLTNNQALDDIPGLSYMQQKEIIYTGKHVPPENLETVANYSLIRGIANINKFTQIFNRKRMVMPVQTSRGCPNKCSFCIVQKMFGPSYRKRPIQNVISEIRCAIQYTKHIVFVDNNFVGVSKEDISKTKLLLKAIKENFSDIEAAAFVTSDIIVHSELLTLLHSSGIRQLIIGFESLNLDSLEHYSKKQSITEIKRSVEVLKEYGFTVSGSFIANSNDDTPRSIIKTACAAKKWNIDFIYYFNWSPFPQTISTVIRKRIFLDNWAYLNGFHLYILTKKCLPSSFQKALLKANRIFYSYDRVLKCLLSGKIKLATDIFLRRLLFNKVENAIKKRKYLSYLRKLERGLYSKNKLDEERLMTAKLKKLGVFDHFTKEVYQLKRDKASINTKTENSRLIRICCTKIAREKLVPNLSISMKG